MEKTLKILNDLKKEGLIGEYAVGGGIAAIFYIETILTFDLDIFYHTHEENNGITSLSPIYDWLKQRGYKVHREHIIIGGIPVQFIPAYNKLVKKAIENAVEAKYKRTSTRIFRPEYLIAIMVQAFRPKDRERIIKILDEVDVDMGFLKKILLKYSLKEKYDNFMRIYFES